MKRNYFNKWAAAVLTFTMLLTGCGQAADSNATDNEILPESAAETDSEVKGDSASSEVASESSGDRQTLKLFVDETWWPYDSWNGRIPEMVSEKLGIDIEVTVAADDTAMNWDIWCVQENSEGCLTPMFVTVWMNWLKWRVKNWSCILYSDM